VLLSVGEMLGGDHGRRPVRERRVREEGEGADRWARLVRQRRGERALGGDADSWGYALGWRGR
jgi:hypothetical protein